MATQRNSESKEVSDKGVCYPQKLFNMYTEPIFREIEYLPGLTIGGENINNFRFADDTALIADTEEKL